MVAAPFPPGRRGGRRRGMVGPLRPRAAAAGGRRAAGLGGLRGRQRGASRRRPAAVVGGVPRRLGGPRRAAAGGGVFRRRAGRRGTGGLPAGGPAVGHRAGADRRAGTVPGPRRPARGDLRPAAHRPLPHRGPGGPRPAVPLLGLARRSGADLGVPAALHGAGGARDRVAPHPRRPPAGRPAFPGPGPAVRAGRRGGRRRGRRARRRPDRRALRLPPRRPPVAGPRVRGAEAAARRLPAGARAGHLGLPAPAPPGALPWETASSVVLAVEAAEG